GRFSGVSCKCLGDADLPLEKGDMSKRRQKRGALFVLVWVSCTLLHAQDFRQTVVVTAAARPVELGSVTRTLTVISRQQIDALPVHSIAEVLRLDVSVEG